MIFALFLLYLWIFFMLYIFVMGVYRAHLAGRLSRTLLVLCGPAVLLGIIVDVVTQYTVATVLFLDLPRSSEYTVTKRFKRYIYEGAGWRSRVAAFVCDNLLDPFDPTDNHC